MKACAFIGYQPMDFSFKYNERHPLCQKIKDALLEQARIHYECGVRRFYIGGERGTDIWAGEAVLSLKERPEYPGIELVCVAPFPGHDNHWNDDSSARLARLLSACNDTWTAASPGKAAAGKKRYRQMIDRSQFIISVCREGQDTRSEAGAAVNYAKKQNKDIAVIHPETAEVICLSQK